MNYKILLVILAIILTGCTGLKNFEALDITHTFAKIKEEKSVNYSIPLVINDKVVYFIKRYSNGGRKNLENTLLRAQPYFPVIKEVLRSEGLPEEIVYLPIIESGFNASALSRKSASGIWQFMQGTARIYGLHSDWWVDERRCFDKSTWAAAKHLKELYLSFKDWHLALAAYNAGGGKISKAIKKYKTRNFWEISSFKRNVIKKETLNYVPKFIATVIVCENLEKFNFKLEFTNSYKPILYDIVEIPDATDLEIIAECAGVTIEEIKFLNPELKRWATPPKYFNYKLRLPYGTKEKFLENFNKIPPEERITYRRHKIEKGESIWSIASLYKVPRDIIIEMNNLKHPFRIRAGDYLIIPIKGLDNAKKIDELLTQKENKLQKD